MRSKISKEIISLVLCLAMVLSIAPVMAQESAAFDPLAPYDETVTIKVGYTLNSDFIYYGGEDVYNNSWTQVYLDRLNIKIEPMWVVDQTQGTTKMNAAIASGNYPDIFGSLDTSTYQDYASSGVIADLTDIFDQYMTEDAKRALNVDEGYALDAAKIDGKLYGIPLLTSSPDSMEVLFVRQDWLDKLGLQVPTTVDELAEVALAFTTKDPDGNGKDDTYGLALDGIDLYNWWGGMEAFFESYGAYPLTAQSSTNFSLIDNGNGELVWGGENAGMKDALTALNTFYKNGWIAQDFGTHDYSKAMSDITTGKAGMFFAPMFGVMTIAADLLANQPNARFVATPLPGVNEGEYGKSFFVSSFNGVAAISSKCEHPEALLKIFALGLELVAYQRDPEVFAKYNGDSSNYSGRKLAVVNPLRPFKNYTNYEAVSAAVQKRDPSGLDVEQRGYYDASIYYLDNQRTVDNAELYAANMGQWAVFADVEGGYAAIVKAVESGAYQPAGYGAAASETMASYSATLTDIIKTGIIKIVYGEESVEYWDTVIKNWHMMGGDEVLEEANAWYQSK